ncbi:MAG: hypothetical protein IPG64_16765 [Haliea sp.]|nr:hypothetical protein [Haliea sp.]
MLISGHPGITTLGREHAEALVVDHKELPSISQGRGPHGMVALSAHGERGGLPVYDHLSPRLDRLLIAIGGEVCRAVAVNRAGTARVGRADGGDVQLQCTGLIMPWQGRR